MEPFAEEAKAEGDVRVTLKALDSTVGRLQDTANAVIETTQTICRPSAPAVDPANRVETESACVVSGQIHTLTGRINDVVDQLNDVLSRMEL